MRNEYQAYVALLDAAYDPRNRGRMRKPARQPQSLLARIVRVLMAAFGAH
jgi:hypothetical protein